MLGQWGLPRGSKEGGKEKGRRNRKEGRAREESGRERKGEKEGGILGNGKEARVRRGWRRRVGLKGRRDGWVREGW